MNALLATKKTASKSKRASTKAPVKKTTAAKKKAQKSKKEKSTTTIIAKIDVGWGNNLYIRGEGDSLCWDKGILMTNSEPGEWVWTTQSATKDITFKLLINDEVWALEDNVTIASGATSIVTPSFP